MKNEENLKAALDAVTEAFPSTPAPKFPETRMALFEEHDDIVKFFKGIEWPSVSKEALEYGYDVGPMTDWPQSHPELWAYYLPCFLLHAVKEGTWDLSSVTNSLRTEQTHRDKVTQSSRHLELLTEKQRHAIALFIKLMIQENDPSDDTFIANIRKSYDEYWSKFV
jgi:hypothetical protein